jgi:hypothetical protein
MDFMNVDGWKRFIIKEFANMTLEKMFESIVVHEADLSVFSHRPKLIFNIDDVLLGGPHQLYVCHSASCQIKPVGMYLHLLQPSIGRGIDMIQRPKITTFPHLLSAD